MNISLSSSTDNHSDFLILAGKSDNQVVFAAPKEIEENIEHYLKHSSFQGSAGELAFLVFDSGKTAALCGMGDGESDVLRKAVGKGLKELRKQGKKDVAICQPVSVPNAVDSLENWCQLVAETSHLALYEYRKFIAPATQAIDNIVVIVDEPTPATKEALIGGGILGLSTLTTRNLVNEPAADMYPEQLAREVSKLGQEHGFEVEIFEEAQCRELGMHAFLSVGQAADKRARLIVMRWKGGEGDTVGLIGKGVTYDTGGLSLKPTSSMLHMKSDMSGSAVVIGTMCALAQMKTEKNVTAVVAACENAIGSRAYRPGDVLRSMNGKSIEIRNTDAEGRLTLADAVCYAIRKENIATVIDVATLTGAVKVALGDHVGGAVTTSDHLYDALKKAAVVADEKFWRLPIDEEYRDLNSSEIADISNVGRDGLAGTVAAAAFVEAFTEGLPWLHLDIAGISYSKKDHDYVSKGGTGRGVRTLYHMINSL